MNNPDENRFPTEDTPEYEVMFPTEDTPEYEAMLQKEGFSVATSYRNDSEDLKRYHTLLDKVKAEGKEFRTTTRNSIVTLWTK